MSKQVSITVVGAGIGGLAAAALLMRAGHDVTVYEQAPRFARVGAGIQMAPNSVKVLRQLGVEEKVYCAEAEMRREPAHLPAHWLGRNAMRALQKMAVATLILTVGGFVAGPGIAQTAQSYPARPIRMVIPFTAGSATDLLARRVAPKMSENWSQQVVVDNRGGAGGTIAAGMVAKATPDGYTLLVHSIAFAMNAALYSNLPYDPVRDFTPVSQIAISTSLLVVTPKLGVKSVKELIALAKQKPGQLSFSTSGVGSGTHLNAEMFKHAAGIDVLHVPYKGVPEALIDIATGRVHYFLSPLVPALPFIKDGRVVPLAVSTARRTSALPDLPTIAEAALPGYEFQAWFGVFAPAGTPRPVVDKVSKEVARIVDLPDIKKQFQIQGEEGRANSPEEFGRFVRAEIDRYRKLVKIAGIKVE